MPRDDEAGFTLLEVLVAFSIAALALTALVRIYGSAASASDRAAEKLAAVEIADERMAEIRAMPSLAEGEIGPAESGGLLWRAKVTQARPEEPDPTVPGEMTLFRVEVSVLARAGGAPVLEVATLRLAPTGRVP